MRAWAVTEPGQPLAHIDVADPPAPKGAEVVVEVTHCGVCHSDVHFWDGLIDVGDRMVPVAALGMTTPYTLGHEIVGRVVATGPDVTGVKPGDQRLVYPWIGCGTCADCLRGEDNLCAAPRSIGVRASGGFGDRVFVPHERYLFDFGRLDPALASTYPCSGLTAYSAIRKLMPLPPDDPIVLIGAGGLGLSAISILRALGHRNIVVLDLSAQNRETAASLGARLTLDIGREDIAAALAEKAGGPVKSVIDFVNNSDTSKLAFAALQKGGRHVMVGLFGGTLTLPLMVFPTRGLTIFGNYVGSPGELRELLDLAQSADLPEIPITCQPRSQVSAALTALREGRVKGRIVLSQELEEPDAP